MKITAIAGKEWRQLFCSPVAYIVLFVTTIVFNVFFYLILDSNGEATLRDVFKVMEFMFVFIVPLLTMKTIAEERSGGTFELLMTSPTPSISIVIGKFLGVFGFFIMILLLTVPYYAILDYFGSPDPLAAAAGYFGLLLEGMLFISIGLWTSSLTKNQVIAAIVSYMFIFTGYFSISFINYLKGSGQDLFRYLCVSSHTENFIVGILNTKDIIYFVSASVFFLVLARFGLERRI